MKKQFIYTNFKPPNKMKKLIISISIILTACGPSADSNEESTIKWIKTAKHPITCFLVTTNQLNGYMKWTLITADGQVFNTKSVYMTFPDTIKSNK